VIFSRLDLRGARVLLTGASSGIGAALALRLAEQGARLVLASRNRAQLEDVAGQVCQRGGEAVVVPADVADPAQRAQLIETTVAALGGLDILINNAGVGAMGWFAEASEERLRRIFEVNFFAAVELTRLALPHLCRGRQRLLVNVSSVVGRRGIPGAAEYAASKFALTGWSESLRPELARQGIHVLVVTPGTIDTGFKNHLLEQRFLLNWQNRRGMPADRCARHIVSAIQRRRHEVVITLGSKLLLWLNRLSPRLVDFLMERFAVPVERK
jgi:short-subunit dehydrogenase